jgi:hypothetical protein
MAGIDRPDRRKEEYLCTSCNMDLVRDIYNKLKSRDDVVFCPNCQRILFIPEHFTAEHAIGGPVPAAKPDREAGPHDDAKAKAAKSAPPPLRRGRRSAAERGRERRLIEARATGELGRALSMAQGESVSRAVKADTTPVDCEVHVDGKLAGIYKGIDVDNLERAIKYFLGELKLSFTTLQVKAITDDAPGRRAATDTSGARGGTSAAPRTSRAPSRRRRAIGGCRRRTATPRPRSARVESRDPAAASEPSQLMIIVTACATEMADPGRTARGPRLSVTAGTRIRWHRACTPRGGRSRAAPARRRTPRGCGVRSARCVRHTARRFCRRARAIGEPPAQLGPSRLPCIASGHRLARVVTCPPTGRRTSPPASA